jgi:hypothetical protein
MSSYTEFLTRLTPEQQARDAANNREQANELLEYANWLRWAKLGIASAATAPSPAAQQARRATAGRGSGGQ